MTHDTNDTGGALGLDALEAVARAATPGPWEHMRGRGLVRAIRGDLAIPLFEVRAPHGDPLEPAPTVRVGTEVVFRANSQGAHDSAAFKREHSNGAFAATFDPPTVLSLITAAREAEGLRAEIDEAMAWRSSANILDRENDRLREALELSREGLSIAAGWARSKPDSQRARDKIKGGLDAIRAALNPRKHARLTAPKGTESHG